MTFALRPFRPADAPAVNRVAIAAFSEYRSAYEDWDGFADRVGRTSELAATGEMIVATIDDEVAGAVTYVGPGIAKSAHFDQAWPVIRTLVVDPAHRGLGIGRALAETCIDRARRDGAALIALRTSPLMTVALELYLRLGFEKDHDVPGDPGVAYAIYVKPL